MLICAKLAKRIWEDDSKMLERIEGCEQVLCSAEINDAFVMTLTPYNFQSNSGGFPYGVASEGMLEEGPAGKPTKVQLCIIFPEGQAAGVIQGDGRE